MAEARPVEEATDAGLTEDYSCGYCLQRWVYMTDPRELPCSHVFCLPCLQDEFTKWNEVQCGICLRTHDIEDLGGLPEAKLLTPPQEPADTESEFCDVCKESPSKAASFCVDCAKKLCPQHLKVHDEFTTSFYGKEHKTILIDVYIAEPNSHKSVTCTEHKAYQLLLACSECYKTFCHECGTSSICDTRFGNRRSRGKSHGSHTIHSLSKMADQLRSSLNDQLKSLSDKVTGLCKDEKEAWRQLSDVEDKAKTMKETVEGLTNEKIAAIKKESEQLKTEIQDYQDECTNKVEVFVSELMARRDDMESLWKYTIQKMNNSHDSELIGEFEHINTKIRDAQISLVEPCTLEVKILISPESSEMKGAGYFSQRLANIPRYMEFRDEQTVTSKMLFSVKIGKDGQILCGTSRGTQIRDLETMNLVTTAANINTMCHDIIQPIEETFIARGHMSGYTRSVKICVVDSANSHEENLFQVNETADKLCRIAQFGPDIYFVDQKNKKLIVHSLFVDDVKEFPLEDASPYAICILPDSSVLIGYIGGNLTKYIFSKETGLKRVWVLHVTAIGIAYDPSTGLVFTASAKDGICVISSEGILLKKLKSDKLMEIKSVMDIAISGDEIILACRDEGLKRFTIRY